MKTKFFTGLAIAAVLLAAWPAFADNGRGGGRGSGGGGGGHAAAFSGGGFRGGSYASGRSYAFGGSSRGYAGGHGGYGYGHSYGGHGGYGYGHGYGGRGYGGYGYGRGYGGYGYGFVYPYYYGGYPYYGYGYDEPAYTVYGTSYNDNGGSVSARVQQELAREGYYRGPIDGIVGPGTQAAISAYQRDNGLRVTGTINGHLLDALDLN